MALDGLWTAEFQVVRGWTNGGVVVLEKGRLFGGDGQYYYAGRLSLNPEDGTSLSGHLKVVHYHGDRTTAFGDAGPVFNLEIQGTMLSATAISGVMKRLGFATLAFRLVRREELF